MEKLANQVTPISARPEGEGRVLVSGAGSRKLMLRRYQNDVIALELDAPPLKKLVLSGGGAKGIAYPGAITALENDGAWAQIEALYASSAGAIAAALLACGIGARQFDLLTDQINLLGLLESSDESVSWVQRGTSSLGELAERNLPGNTGSYARLLLNILPRIQSSADELVAFIRQHARVTLLQRIAAETAPAIIAIGIKLENGGAVTFGDLATLFEAEVPNIKQLNITGTAMFEGAPQLVLFNAAQTPDMDIAEAVRISSALPLVLSRPDAQGLAFQEYDELTFFQDGGLLLNTPVPQLIDPARPLDSLAAADLLILSFSADDKPASRGGFLQFVTDWLTGLPVSSTAEFHHKALQDFAGQTVIAPLKTELGDFSGLLTGTLNFSMSDEIRDHLQDRLKLAVEAHLLERSQRRERYVFASMDQALLAMNEDMLTELLVHTADDAVYDVLNWRREADRLLGELDAALLESRGNGSLQLTDASRTALTGLDGLGSEGSRRQWLTEQLNQPLRTRFQGLLQVVGDEASGFAVLDAAVVEMRVRTAGVIASNIRRYVIFPSLHLFQQSQANIDLLLGVDQQLVEAQTSAQINQALDQLIEGYRSRTGLVSRPLRSTTIEMAKAWRINQSR